MNIRDFGAKGDGQADDTQALLAAISSVRSRVHSLPGVTLHGGGAIDVPGGVYRVTGEIGLRNRERLRLEPDAWLVFDSGGLALDSFFINSHAEIEVTGGNLYSTHGGIGLHARGGAYSLISGSTWTGWDEAWRLVGSNGITIRDAIVSAWGGVGTQAGVGVRFAPAPVGGGSCNGNVVERTQFNGRSIGVWSEDGSGNEVKSCNFNAPGEMLRCEGAQSLTIAHCQAEGVSGDAYVRLGTPGGYADGAARVVALSLAIRDCVFSWNEPQAPAVVLFERNSSVRALDTSGTKLLVDRRGTRPILSGAQPPWQAGMSESDAFRYLLANEWTRRGMAVASTSPGAPGSPGLIDRPLYGFDRGPL